MSTISMMGTSPTISSPRNEGIALAARVASARVVHAMKESPDVQVLFMIVGLSKRLTSAVARQIAADIPGVSVFIHEEMADDNVPSKMISHQSIAHYRNSPRDVGGGAVVFAPDPRELDDVGNTAGDIQQLSEAILVSMPEIWLECCPELLKLDSRNRQYVINILKGIAQAQILTAGLEMFGEFVWRLDDEYNSHAIERALDQALPALRIPSGAGRFKKPSPRGRLTSVEAWSSRFRELNSVADDALSLRRDGSPLKRDDLRNRLRDIYAEGSITEDQRLILSNLVEDQTIEPGKWRPTQEAASELPWSAVERLVKSSKRKLQQPLGELTLRLFSEKIPTELCEEDQALLTSMAPDAENADEDERIFFFRQRNNISECSKALLKRWEQYVFKKIDQHNDISLGIFLSIAHLVKCQDIPLKKPFALVYLNGAERIKFWESQNLDLCRFMRDRYRGLPKIFERAGVILDFGMCWTGDWDSGSISKVSKNAREFKFNVFLLDADENQIPIDPNERKKWLAELSKTARNSTQLTWNMTIDSMASSYADNMNVIANLDEATALLASGRFSRAQDKNRSTNGRLSLERRTTIQDANGRPEGELVDPNDITTRVGSLFEQALAQLRGDIISEADAKAIEQAYTTFAASYSDAVRAMVRADGLGLCDPALLRQSVLYGELLNTLRTKARKDDCRRALWQPILSIGIAFSDDSPQVAICTPWHPFKLAAASAKALQLSDALSKIINSVGADIKTFSANVVETLSDNWYPSIALCPSSPKPFLLSETDQFADFALMEPPTRDQGAANSFDGYLEHAADELLEVAVEYLDIQPHERSNFSVVLYNVDNRGLPSYLASALAKKVEQEKDLRCDLILTHSDQRRLRQIYTEQNVAISAKLDEALASEAAQSFLSRLRVGFIDLGGLGQTDQIVQAADLVFLHDVIARGARVAWRRVKEKTTGWIAFENAIPNGETKRRHFEKGARKTESLLVPAEIPLEVQRYIDLIHDFHVDFRDIPDGHYVPIREIDFDESGVGMILDQAHRVARWVVTYDAIADMHLFRSNSVDIIRYVPRPRYDHNLVVSTRDSGPMLVTKLSEEVARILHVKAFEAEEISHICIKEASAISGRVVLRAARLENNALELLGLVLSRRIFLDSLESDMVPVCWLLLDDFAERLGHKGSKADILVIVLSIKDGVPTVDLVVIESKFTGLTAESSAMSESMNQMHTSTNDLRDRIIGSGDTLNRATWLRRLADLLLEQGAFPSSVGGYDAQDWSRLIRTDEVDLRITGLSMVFVHDRYDGTAEPLVPRSPEQYQHVFNRNQVAEGLRRVQASGTGAS